MFYISIYLILFYFHIDKDAYILKFYTVIYYEPIVTHFCDLSSGSNTIKLEIQWNVRYRITLFFPTNYTPEFRKSQSQDAGVKTGAP